MAPTKSKKKLSDAKTILRTGTKVPLRDEPSTPQRSPIKKRKMGISLRQKQTLIENLQLEITERARRLRAQYHAHAQGIRSRIEMRVNRIPTTLRKMTMSSLLQKYLDLELQKAASLVPPPVPAKDYPARTQPKKGTQVQALGRQKRPSGHDISMDKENENEHGEHPKKRARGAQVIAGSVVRPVQVLSPTSSNSRLKNRGAPGSPNKQPLSRPGSPLKTSGTSRSATATRVLSNMVEKAKAARAASTRKVTTSSTANSRPGTAMGTNAKTRRGAPASKAAPVSRPATRAGRRVSNTSETSESSTTTVVRKPTASKPTAASTRKTVMGSIRKGMTGNSSKNTGTLPTSSSGRVLRKRG